MAKLAVWLLFGAGCALLISTRCQSATQADSDHDGLPDGLETQLIEQFRPTWMVSAGDCSNVPARFIGDSAVPRVSVEDGTIYAQVRPAADGAVELHYYHLWRRDCGELGHPLDTEHVAVLLHKQEGDWRATHWYAAAHEDTLCDAGQITRASTIDAVQHGARVWVSAGKHASYLAEKLCNYGCGGDRCAHMVELPAGSLVNLGEVDWPLVAWTHATQWPLLEKMTRTDFTAARMARLQRLPETDIAWSTPERRPAQAAILGTNAGLGGAATGAHATNTALSIASDHTGNALGTAARKTGGALQRSYHGVRRSLGRIVGEQPAPQK